MSKQEKIAFIRCSRCIFYKNLEELNEGELDVLVNEIVRSIEMETDVIARSYIPNALIFPN